MADSATDKRAKIVEELLKSDGYAVNWGRYWRDMRHLSHAGQRQLSALATFDRWWTTQAAPQPALGRGRHRPRHRHAASTTKTAPVNYLTRMYGNPVEIAATTSRVFLGVQIQCAECHDAKTEPWKREQFHEFAAFFGRAQAHPAQGRGRPRHALRHREPTADGQYSMTDKKDPDRLIPMQPRFLTGESVSLDADDEERRQALARFLTSPKNPWFARCYVNRIWTALMGWGFYPTVIRPRLGVHAAYTRTCWNCWQRSGSPAATTCNGCSAPSR